MNHNAASYRFGIGIVIDINDVIRVIIKGVKFMPIVFTRLGYNKPCSIIYLALIWS